MKKTVEVIREKPEPPPIKEVVVRLTERQARSLATVLNGGISMGTLNVLGLDDVARDLNKTVGQNTLAFRSVGYL